MSGISLPVGSHLDESQARRTTKQAEDYFSTAGRQAGDAFSRNVNEGLGRVDTGKAAIKAAELQRAYDKAADAAGKLRVEEAKLAAVNAASNSTNSQKIAAVERVEKARRAESRAVRELTNDLRNLEQASGSLSVMGSAASTASTGMSSLAKSAASFGAVGLATTATVGADALVNLTGIALSAAQSLWALPAGLGAAAAGVGTLTLATHGFADVVTSVGDPKKFAEGIQALAPSAQQAALEIQAMMPELKKLQSAAQEALFSGSAPALRQVSDQYLPMVTQLTTGISKAFDNAWRGISAELMTTGMQSDITRFVDNTVSAFDKLSGVTGPLTHALGDLVAVGSDFLPGLASGATNAAQAFADFINNAKQSGQLSEWIHEGFDTVEQLGKVIWNAGDAIIQLAGRGTEYLPGLANDFKRLADDVDGLASGLSVVVNTISLINKGMSGDPTFFTDVKDYLTGAQSFTGHRPSHTDAGPATTQAPQVFGPAYPNLPRLTGPTPAGTLAPNDLGDLLGGASSAPPATADYKSWYGQNPWQPDRAVPPAPPATGHGGGGTRQPLPTVPYGNQDPMGLLQGSAATASLYGAAGTVLDNQQKVAQAQSDLNTLEKANVRDEDAIVAKRNELARAQREEHESELRLNEAKQQAVQKTLKGMQATQGDLQQLGVQIDKDFGISKGFGGIVENAVKALGNILAAPFLQALGFVAKANPNEGSGLIGIGAANGLFGPQYTPGVIAASQGPGTTAMLPQYTPEAMGGNVGAAIALAQSANGGKYGWGASDLAHGLADCSGAVSDLVEVLQKGGATPGRLFDTESFPGYAASHGWQRGTMAGALNVGVSHGGPGGGHMAATLPNGVNFESGGSHGDIAYGGPAAGAGDKQFTEQWYLPTIAGPVAPSSIPSPTSSGNILPPLTNPDTSGLSFPGQPLASGGAPLHPGIGPANAIPGVTPLGQVTPTVGGGVPYPTQGGNSGNILGGMPMDGIMAAASGLDMMFPGAGSLAKIGTQVINRTIGYAAQNAGILASGIGEFFSVGDNPKGSIGAGWAGKLAGGIAGAGMALPNIAGQKAPEQKQGNGQQGGGNTYGDTNIMVQAREGASGQEHGEQVAAETSRMWAPAGRQ
ncbi:hypothetical protein [Mycolicibacterium sp. lyk4-40-TYG-92]|uniref:hypothetical protein n=1 Tax=Mycolicibacterium sp. lyk4-40-TYG-92 TaxID=3040295 RepID=UPI00255096F2|nr:hypothetical protein [Mycolicibacterium sp. lyk4-40-TYG-92]